MTERQEKLNKLARDVLTLSRNTLLVNLRFLDAALSQFELISIEESTLLTDGRHILYNPRHILDNYKREKEIPVRDYLHIVMHCVFKHMYMDPSLNRPYWDLACDIAVEYVITELNLKAVTTARERRRSAERGTGACPEHGRQLRGLRQRLRAECHPAFHRRPDGP